MNFLIKMGAGAAIVCALIKLLEAKEQKEKYSVLRYLAIEDTQTNILAAISNELLPLGDVTTAETKTDLEDVIKNPYDMFFYFGHGFDDCLFDENGYCTIYADENLIDKILVLTACNTGKGYARSAVRIHGAVASLGYGAPLVAQFAGNGFTEGFKECFLNAQQLLLNTSEIDESTFTSAYESTKNLYNSYGDEYTEAGDDFTAHLFYANANNFLSYSKWDVETTVDVSVTPTPAEIYHFGEYVGMAPLDGYNILSSGNVFRYKAIGCFLSWLITNVPKEGSSYNLSPMNNFNKDTRRYDSENVYLEHDKRIYISPEGYPRPFEMSFYNYGDTVLSFSISNDKNWHQDCPTEDKIYPHSMNGNSCYIKIEEDYPHYDYSYTDEINITVTINGVIDTFAVLIWIHPSPTEETKINVSEPLWQLPLSSPIFDQFTKMSSEEQNRRTIVIGDKTYTPLEIINEIKKGSEVGLMFIK